MRKNLAGILLVLLLLLAGALSPAFASLERVGPVDLANGGYPAWYQDTTGLSLEFCKPINQAELNDGWCLLLPADVPSGAVPEVPFTNYSEEHFYFDATAGNRTDGLLVLALEGAFGIGAPAAGDQIVFGRLRISIPNLPVSGDYKVYTPYGDFNFPGLVAGEKLFFTADIGISCGTQFDCAVTSPIGPFLLPSAAPGGGEVPPIPDLVAGSGVDPYYDFLADPNGGGGVTPYPGTGRKYVADPARLGPVTGSPLLAFVGNDGVTYNHNIFRIETNNPTRPVVISEPNFALMGRVMTAAIPGRVTVGRASYRQTATSNKLDVFATAFPTTQGRIPGSTVLPQTNPDLGFYDAPCATDPSTGAVTGPPTGQAGFFYYQMLHSGNNWWGMNQPAVIPPQVCVQDLNARNAQGQAVPAYFLADVTDEVDLTVADWDPTVNGGTLIVTAVSNDQLTQPTLTVAGFGPIDPATGTLTVSPLQAPPAKVTVISTRGGVASLDVRTGFGFPVSSTVPVTNADGVTTLEDTPAISIGLLANDTINGVPFDPASATVTITVQGRLGQAVLNADNTITYTPSANMNGTDIIGYTVTVNGSTSNEGYLTVIINPVNDPPAANNDATGTTNGRSVTINVLANDTDPDGAEDLANAVIVSLPGAGATLTCDSGAVCTGGLVTFTPSSPGTFTFTYQAQDIAGALSATAATVTVTVNASENIVITKSQYVVSKNRWRVEGTDSISGGQSLTIAYNNGIFADGTSAVGYPISTAVVSAGGAWALDLGGTGRLNPNDSTVWSVRPTSLRVISPLGGSATANISLK